MIPATILSLELRIPPAVLTTYVDPQPKLSTLRPKTLTHSAPAPVSRATLSAPDLGPQQQSAKSLGKQPCDDVPHPATSTPTTTLLDPSTVDIQRPLSHIDNHRGSAASLPPLHIEQVVQEYAQCFLLEAQAVQERAQRCLLEERAQSVHRRLFDQPSAGGHDCFYVIAAQFQYARVA